MVSPVSSASSQQAALEASQAASRQQPAKPQQAAARGQDTVSLSNKGDVDHDGDSK